jgi:hypothetical protein
MRKTKPNKIEKKARFSLFLATCKEQFNLAYFDKFGAKWGEREKVRFGTLHHYD